jgi:hypothetical protein
VGRRSITLSADVIHDGLGDSRGGPGLVIGLKAGDRNLQPVDGIQCA